MRTVDEILRPDVLIGAVARSVVGPGREVESGAGISLWAGSIPMSRAYLSWAVCNRTEPRSLGPTRRDRTRGSQRPTLDERLARRFRDALRALGAPIARRPLQLPRRGPALVAFGASSGHAGRRRHGVGRSDARRQQPRTRQVAAALGRGRGPARAWHLDGTRSSRRAPDRSAAHWS